LKKKKLDVVKMFLHSIQHGSTQALFAALDVIRNASKTVQISSYYIEANGKSAQCLFDTLLECKAQTIQILTDYSLWEAYKIHSYLQRFACIPNVEIRGWNHLFMNSNHGKFIIADNEDVCIGGYNFQEAFFMEPGAWNDVGMVISSKEIASSLTMYFNSMWEKSKIFTCKNVKTNLICPKERKGREKIIDASITKYQMITQYPNQWFLHSHKSNAFYQIINLLSRARKTICILCPNVIDSCIWSILSNKLKEGVKIKIITNQNQNRPQTFFTIGQQEETFFQGKKRNYSNLQIRFSNTGLKHTRLKTNGKDWVHDVDHSKYFDIDKQHFYIGSFNLDAMSLHACAEIGLLVFDEPQVTLDVHRFLFHYCWQRSIV